MFYVSLYSICFLLFLQELVNDSSRRGKKKKEPKAIFSTVPLCLVSSLKLVELKRSIPGNEGEIELLRYLLKNSTILEKLKLDVYYTKKAECDFLKELLTMPRCSSACEVHCCFVPKENWLRSIFL